MQSQCLQNKTLESIHHPFKPVKDSNSKILILGSFPSVASREQDFYYSHPRNRFWKVLENLLKCELENKKQEEKCTFLLAHRIALYDVCVECQITNSSDSTLKPIKIAPLESLIQNTQIQHIFLNGKKAAQIYQKAFKDSKVISSLSHTALPSTSPANAKWNLEKLCQEWSAILIALRNKNEIH